MAPKSKLTQTKKVLMATKEVKTEDNQDETTSKRKMPVKSEPIDETATSSHKKVKPPLRPKSEPEDDDLDIKYVHEPVSRQNGIFTFPIAPESLAKDIEMIQKFHPNRSPEEVLRAGAFGGTYFRTIRSGVCQKTITNAWKELPTEWIQGLDPSMYLSKPWKDYDATINKFGVKSGTTLEDWESSGWINRIDPFGWFQWYCRFFQGRRSPDDNRQIDRWLKCCGPTGRWKGNLCGKIVLAGSSYDDTNISPVVRQTLLHWGYELTQEDFDEVKKRLNKGKGAYFINKDQLNSVIAKQKK